jgi:cytochrome o ubiquinol oxidase subunit 2
MNKKIKVAIFALLVAGVVTMAVLFFRSVDVPVFDPKGQIADRQRDLIIFTLILSAVVVIPVFTLLGIFAWKFREGSKNATYRPNWDNNRLLETIWWGIPCVIILVLGVVTWQTSHELDPYKSLTSNVKPVNIQVVALQWKWLFIYPDQHVASVNLLELPEKTPINFKVTADAPMNSFWIPSLGGQVYAMSGMSTQLHLMADTTGDYKGSSANISGKGFSDMAFTAYSVTKSDFDAWVHKTRKTGAALDKTAYDTLAQPAVEAKPLYYNLEDANLYNEIIMKYMAPQAKDDTMKMKDMPGMEEMR